MIRTHAMSPPRPGIWLLMVLLAFGPACGPITTDTDGSASSPTAASDKTVFGCPIVDVEGMGTELEGVTVADKICTDAAVILRYCDISGDDLRVPASHTESDPEGRFTDYYSTTLPGNPMAVISFFLEPSARDYSHLICPDGSGYVLDEGHWGLFQDAGLTSGLPVADDLVSFETRPHYNAGNLPEVDPQDQQSEPGDREDWPQEDDYAQATEPAGEVALETPPLAAEDAARKLLEAWESQSRSGGDFATQEAIGQLYRDGPRSETVDFQAVTFLECSSYADEAVLLPAQLCEFRLADLQSVQVYVYGSASTGHRVEQVAFNGNPPGFAPVD